MTRKEFLDKEHDFVGGTDTDVVRFYHTTIMNIFDDMEKEKQMNEIYVLITQPNYTHYDFYKTEKEALDVKEQVKKFDPKSYAEVEKWDMIQFANWVSKNLQVLNMSPYHIG